MNRKAISITGAHYFELTPTQVDENRHLGNEGNAEAAFRLYEHYAFGVGDEGTAVHWLRKAGELGHKKAKQHLDVEATTEESRRADGGTGAPAKDPFENGEE
jgi:TPR repeat protein